VRPRHEAPWLDWDLGREMQVLSFAPHRPGLVRARRILWREVRDADLPREADALAMLAGWVADRGGARAVCFLTSRALDAHVLQRATVEGVTAEAVATVGLSNAERIGTRASAGAPGVGTINLALRLDLPLAPAGLIEALSLVAEARTAAVLEGGPTLPSGRATGTGTDCIAVAAPEGRAAYAGKHTAAGEALGRAAYRAVRAGVAAWMAGPGASDPRAKV
jgi:adenosylcobinamide amidohydrolase